MNEYSFILDNLIFSYSCLETYERCPKCFYLNYILKKAKTEGFFGQFGSFSHKLLESYFKNELFSFELSDKFENDFTKTVTAYAPPARNGDMAKNYFDQGLRYFQNFEGFDSSYEILGVEHKHNFKIGKYNFTGILDIEAKENDDYIVVDHKTKGKQDKKKLGKNDIESDWIQLVDGRYIPFSLAIQLYIYCISFKECYGEYPKYLNWNMLRIGDWYKLEFNLNDFNRSIKWALDLIEQIYNDTTFNIGTDISDFWCNFTCGDNIYCSNSSRYIEGC